MRPAISRCVRAVLSFVAVGGLVGLPGVARATNVYEYPDNGSEQMGRGGAWVARASDPLAVLYNPAGLAGQETRLSLQSNVSVQSTCLTRVKSTADQSVENLADANGNFPQVCNASNVQIGPQLAFTYRLTDRIGLGFMPIVGPSAANGNTSWPEFVNDANGRPQAAPQRYMLIKANLLLITPTLGIGGEVIDNLRLGASFQWGIASFDFKSSTTALNQSGLTPAGNDILSEIKGHQIFIPGFTLGALWSATDSLDVAGWYRWSAPVDTSGDLQTQANYFTGAVANGNTKGIKTGDTSQSDCGIAGTTAGTCHPGMMNLKLVLPMEAKLGVRFHKPRGGVPPVKHKRDPLSQDLFDAEVDLTWANNSAADYLQIRFPGDANGEGVIPSPITGGNVPPIADVRHHFKDVVGIRLGGDFNALADKLAVRAGAFFETKGQDSSFQNIDVVGAQKIGIALGGTYRIHFGQKTSALEISLGLMHVFYADEANNNPNGQGLSGLAGQNCNPHEAPSPSPTCMNGNQKFRTNWPVNLGTITNSVNVLNVGLGYRF